MLTRRLGLLCRKILSQKRNVHLSRSHNAKRENPFKRTLRILGDDLKNVFTPDRSSTKHNVFPNQVDIVVIGGGAMGSSIAYWLKEKSSKEGITIAVIEKDLTYSKCSTVLSVGGLRQQFSLPENIQMSLYGAEFLRDLENRFGPNADVFFTPHGYLMLASPEGATQLLDNAKLQKELGAINEILKKEELKNRFPWLNVHDVEVGCLGLEKEGWFDPWSLLTILRNGAIGHGARYVEGEAVDFMFRRRMDIICDEHERGLFEQPTELVVKLPNGELRTIQFALCVIAAGANSGEVAKLARIGDGAGMLSVPLPVEKRKRYVYRWDCQGEGPGLNTPMTIDHTGAYFRRDGLGGSYIGGLSPLPEEEPNTDNLDVDHQYFDEKIWPKLANRVPAFNALKVRGAWGGYYDFNCYDENGIIGQHPYYGNMYFATGFSGHGIQQAPAVGRAIAELILDGKYQTIDLSRFSFDRLISNTPMLEACIV